MKRATIFLILLTITSFVNLSAQTPQDSLTIVKTKWQKEKAAKGVQTLHASFPSLYNAPQDIYIVDIKLKKHKIDVCTHKGRELTTDHAKAEKAITAVNGTFFDMEKGPSICFTARNGHIDAKTVNYFTPDGAIEISGKQVELIPWSKDQENTYDVQGKSIMVSSPLLMQDGKSVLKQKNEDPARERHPRTALVLTKKNHLLMIVVDGRNKGVASGMTLNELTYFCRCIGAYDALNLDGGGSSVIWTEKQGILNHPSDGRERTVSNSILVF